MPQTLAGLGLGLKLRGQGCRQLSQKATFDETRFHDPPQISLEAPESKGLSPTSLLHRVKISEEFRGPWLPLASPRLSAGL